MKLIENIKKEVVDLFPEKVGKLSGTYCTRGWIFPNHLNPMIDIAKELCLKYGGDVHICEIACLLHDTGLVYNRKSDNPLGHESNSLEFAKRILEKHKVEENKIDLILDCIKATEVDYEPTNINEKIVRTADILSQYYSIHFFAKAHFYPTWEMYLNFLEKKVNKGFNKICFEDERDKVKPIYFYLQTILAKYKKYNLN